MHTVLYWDQVLQIFFSQPTQTGWLHIHSVLGSGYWLDPCKGPGLGRVSSPPVPSLLTLRAVLQPGDVRNKQVSLSQRLKLRVRMFSVLLEPYQLISQQKN